MFVFDGGVLSPDQISDLRLADGELSAYKFCTEQQASTALRPYVWRRVQIALNALQTGHAQYLHDGYPTG
jgi:8-oxo-dGTP diphosphatase